MSFKSGVVHQQIPSDKDTALGIIDTIKKNSGLFVDQSKAYKAPIDNHNWQTVPNGMKLFDEKGNFIKHVTYLIENIGGKKFKRSLERCVYCSQCKEQGFNRERVR